MADTASNAVGIGTITLTLNTGPALRGLENFGRGGSDGGGLLSIFGGTSAGKMFGGIARLSATAARLLGGSLARIGAAGAVGFGVGIIVGIAASARELLQEAAGFGFRLLINGPEYIESLLGWAAASGTVVAGVAVKLQGIGRDLLSKGIIAFGPALLRLSDIIAEDRMGPAFNAVAEGLGALAFVGVEVFAAVVDGLRIATTTVEGWVQEWTGGALVLGSTGRAVFGVLKALGQGAGYLWDALRVGLALPRVVFGLVVEGAGRLVKAVAGVVTDLARQLPDAIRPGWIDDIDARLQGWGDMAARWGRGLRDDGLGTIAAFGESAKLIGAWFDRAAERMNQRRANLFTNAAARGLDMKLAGAALKDSEDAYRIVARHRTENAIQQTAAAKKTEQLEKCKEALEGWRDALRGRLSRSAG